MLQVNLAGYNVDTDVLEKLKKNGWDGKNNITPETISAAYARISRDPRPVNELRADAREEVDKARKSNENIVFKMGHHSVAEHAYLNFDILGLSRLAVEYLEEARLCSYTEKSQRYITLEGDYVRPAEFKGRELRVFDETVKIQVETYKKMLPVLFEYQKKKNPGMLASKSGLNTVEGWAKEDARYVLPIATECQLGFSANARNLEHIIRKLKYCGLNEARQLGTMLYEKAKHVVPSLIILSDPDAFKRQFGREVSDGLLKSGSGSVIKAMSKIRFGKAKPSVKPALLLEHTADPDTKIIAALLHSYSGRNYGACLAASVKMGKNAKKVFMKAILRDATEHDPLYREFEAAVFKMELVLSSSAFAQLKRHRMMSLFKQSYDIKLGVTVPPAVKETKQEALFMKVIEATDKAYSRLACASPEAAQYILTNSHRRRVIISANLREIYHIARLRMDRHAQWDIQNVSSAIASIVRKTAPLSAGLLCGKDSFEQTRKEFMG